MKLWGGRFTKDQNSLMREFNNSFKFDKRLYAEDIKSSKAYAKALQQIGVLTEPECESIVKGLGLIQLEFENDQFISIDDEDVHTAIERRLTELIGKTAGKLHTGRSRNDQVALDLRLFVMRATDHTIHLLEELQESIITQAEKNIDIIMPGYTHFQPAQPVLFSHWVMSFFWMFERDKSRLQDALVRTSVSPLGSGALAGNPFKIDRKLIADTLGMTDISMNSLDAVSDRDFVLEFLSALAQISVHISRLAEDIILFSNPAFGYFQIGEAFSTGSSLMPQKRNPDSMELARGKTGRIISALVNLLIVLKGLPSTYNKDLQEDKEALFDSFDNLSLTLSIVAGVIHSLNVYPDRMVEHLDETMLATDMADYLVARGVPFREAHFKVGEVVQYSEVNNITFSAVPLEVLQSIAPQFGKDIYEVLNYKVAIRNKNLVGGTAPQAVRQQIKVAKSLLDANEGTLTEI